MSSLPTMTLDASALRDLTPPNAEDVVVRLLAGRIEAVGEAYDEHHEVVRRFARRLVGEEAAAEDLVQEVFVALPKVIRTYRGDSTLRSFLLGVAVQMARRHVRTAMRRRKTVERAELEPAPAGMGQGRDCPEEFAERKRLARVLTLALDRLSLDHRAVFVLAEVEGKNSREIGEIVGAPEGTVRTRLLHAKKNLREFLSEKGLP